MGWVGGVGVMEVRRGLFSLTFIYWTGLDWTRIFPAKLSSSTLRFSRGLHAL
jgi:hypothetical protein